MPWHPGARVGLSVKAEDTSVKRVIGIVISDEGECCVVALPHGVMAEPGMGMGAEIKVGAKSVEVSYVRVASKSLVLSPAWPSDVPELVMEHPAERAALMKKFYTMEGDPPSTETEMASARSGGGGDEAAILREKVRVLEEQAAMSRGGFPFMAPPGGGAAYPGGSGAASSAWAPVAPTSGMWPGSGARSSSWPGHGEDPESSGDEMSKQQMGEMEQLASRMRERWSRAGAKEPQKVKFEEDYAAMSQRLAEGRKPPSTMYTGAPMWAGAPGSDYGRMGKGNPVAATSPAGPWNSAAGPWGVSPSPCGPSGAPGPWGNPAAQGCGMSGWPAYLQQCGSAPALAPGFPPWGYGGPPPTRGISPSAAGAGPPPAPMDPGWAMMSMMEQWSRKMNEDAELAGGGKAFRRLTKLKRRVMEQPQQVTGEYIRDCMLRLGAEPSDNWQLYQMTEKINWKNQLGLKRCHWYVSHALTHLLRGETHVGEAYLTQLLRGLHQVALEGGGWETACLMLPGHDPCSREPYGCTEEDLHTIAAYRDAERRITGGNRPRGYGKGGEKGEKWEDQKWKKDKKGDKTEK